ncbi:MAG TPA: cryptochrome/photolyase family protein, partial [Pseudonocardia sp.]|nr:cryptochrome/photolyase family protein [Pseudonocardia sp.]
MSEPPLWVFADQLGPHVHGTEEHRHREVVLVESERALRRGRRHRQKLHLVLSGVRHLAAELGDRAVHLRTATYREALERLGRPVLVHEPTSHAAARFVARLRREGLVADVLPTPTFALPRAEFEAWAGERETFRMEDFYRAQRRRFDVLMEGGEPVGGRWNLDHDNREPPPKGAVTLDVPPPWHPPEDEIDEQVRADLDRMDLPTVGRDGPRLFAVTAAEARRALAHFVTHRLAHFGPHEDAVLTGDWAMAHSLLSVPLNLGLLHPLDVVAEAEAAHRAGDVPLASAEGFVRQVLGWREYMWQLYWRFGEDYLRRNALGAHTRLPGWWAELDAGAVTARCLRTALEGVR